jgi:hypothetical protein
MAKGWTPWRDGRRAWARLESWGPGGPSTKSGERSDGEGALNALADIGLVRHLLDQAELMAVRTARRHSKSWAEIATKLGVTRQSAWERWRELDEAPEAPAPGASPPRDQLLRELALEIQADAAAELTGSASKLRRSATTLVPNVIGLTWDDARDVLLERQLVATGPDPDGPPLTGAGWPDGIVVDQSPESGAKVPPGSHVKLWLERGGGSAGVREPRRPSPKPKSAREMRPEPSDDPVS